MDCLGWVLDASTELGHFKREVVGPSFFQLPKGLDSPHLLLRFFGDNRYKEHERSGYWFIVWNSEWLEHDGACSSWTWRFRTQIMEAGLWFRELRETCEALFNPVHASRNL